MILQNQMHFHLLIKDFVLIEDLQRYVKLEDNKNSYIGSEKFKGF